MDHVAWARMIAQSHAHRPAAEHNRPVRAQLSFNVDVLKLLTRVRAHLQPGGRFIFDVFNPNVAMLARDPGQVRSVFATSEVQVFESSRYDDATQCVHTTWRFPEVSELLVLRCYFPQELLGLLDRAGFEVLAQYGDFQRTTFASGAAKQVYICR
ncbi:MAG: hypothetical protein U0931_21480 [Vulcanimicrobiota bacterium]